MLQVERELIWCAECGSNDIHMEEIIEHYLDKFPICVGYVITCKECGSESRV